MAPHSSTLTWKIAWTEEPGRLQSMGSLRVGHDWATSLSLFTFMHWRRKWQPTPVFLPGESQGRAAVYGVAQSRTQLKQFSSSSKKYLPNPWSQDFFLCSLLEAIQFYFLHLGHWSTLILVSLLCVLSHVWLFATPWTCSPQAPLFMEFSRQEYWSGLSFSTPVDLPDPGIKPMSAASPVLAGKLLTTAPPGKPWIKCYKCVNWVFRFSFFSPCEYSTFLSSLFLGLSFLPLNFSGTFVKTDLIIYVQEYFWTLYFMPPI